MNKMKKTGLSFLVTLFISYYAGIFFFPHTHIINGVTIAHSHLHTDSHHETADGSHSDIILITLISHFEYIDFYCDHVPDPQQFLLHQTRFVETAHWVASIYLENPSLRAPPV